MKPDPFQVQQLATANFPDHPHVRSAAEEKRRVFREASTWDFPPTHVVHRHENVVTKSRILLTRIGQAGRAHTFSHVPHPGVPHHAPYERRFVQISDELWQEMGSPEFLTMTLEPGDKLNSEPVAEPPATVVDRDRRMKASGLHVVSDTPDPQGVLSLHAEKEQP